MAERFNLSQRISAVKCYYQVNNAEEVRRRWSQFADSRTPSRSAILRLVEKFEQTGSVIDVKPTGRPQNARTAELSGAIAASLERSPQKSTRRLSVELGVSQSTVLRALHDMNYHPFRPRLVHGLLEDDPFQRMTFCEQFLNMVEDDQTVVDRIIWSDEAMFKLNGHVNRHNCVYCPRTIQKSSWRRKSTPRVSWFGPESGQKASSDPSFSRGQSMVLRIFLCSATSSGLKLGVKWKIGNCGSCRMGRQPIGPRWFENGLMKSSSIAGSAAEVKLHGLRGLPI
jgi:hypothetical protein